MTDAAPPVTDRFAHLRTHAAHQKQMTVDRLKQAIMQLEREGRPITTFTIKEVSGLDYMAYYRNPEAFTLFRSHSTHLRKVREKAQEERRATRRKWKKQEGNLQEASFPSRDPLLNYKKPRLVAALRTAQMERDQTQQHYHALLQAHMECGVTIARLEAQVAEYLAFMDRFRSSLQREEYHPKD